MSKGEGWKISGGRNNTSSLYPLHESLKIKLSWAAVKTLESLTQKGCLGQPLLPCSATGASVLWGRENDISIILRQCVLWKRKTGLGEYLRNHQHLNIDLCGFGMVLAPFWSCDLEIQYMVFRPRLGFYGCLNMVSCEPVLFTVWSSDQQHPHHFRACYKSKILDPTPNLPNPNLHFSKISKSFECPLKFEKMPIKVSLLFQTQHQLMFFLLFKVVRKVFRKKMPFISPTGSLIMILVSLQCHAISYCCCIFLEMLFIHAVIST